MLAPSIMPEGITRVVSSSELLTAPTKEGGFDVYQYFMEPMADRHMVAGTKSWIGFVGEGVDAQGQLAYYTFTEYWNVKPSGNESKHIVSACKEIKGKNIGRVNETTPLNQAVLELISAIALQKKGDDYMQVDESLHELRLPMLAESYKEKNFPWDKGEYIGQYKFDGFRCQYNEKLGWWSRERSLFIQDCVRHLYFPTDRYVYDGELMLPIEMGFQYTGSAIKKFRPGLSDQLEFHVYNLRDPENPLMPYAERRALLEDHIREMAPSKVKLVHQVPIRNHAEMVAFHDQAVDLGYEGAMVYETSGLYIPTFRSDHLWKYKVMKDGEFEIVGVNDGAGKDVGIPTFVCVTKDGVRFNAPSTGPEAHRRALWARREKLVGCMATVVYQSMTDEGSLRFPKVKAIAEAFDRPAVAVHVDLGEEL